MDRENFSVVPQLSPEEKAKVCRGRRRRSGRFLVLIFVVVYELSLSISLCMFSFFFPAKKKSICKVVSPLKASRPKGFKSKLGSE